MCIRLSPQGDATIPPFSDMRKISGGFYATQFLSLAIYRSKGVSTVLPTA